MDIGEMTFTPFTSFTRTRRTRMTAGLRSMVSETVLTPKDFIFRYKSPAHFMQIFRDYYGPVHKAFLALGEPAKQEALAADLTATIAAFDKSTDGSMRVPSAYSEIVITKA